MEELAMYLPGLNLYIVIVAFALTYTIKTFIAKNFFAKDLGARLTPLLPLLTGIAAAYIFKESGLTGTPPLPSSVPASLPSSMASSLPALAKAATQMATPSTLGLGILNGFYSMGFYQLVKRGFFGKQVADIISDVTLEPKDPGEPVAPIVIEKKAKSKDKKASKES